ncbi:MAG: hypothetical protein IBJ03_13750 [Gemmatimonadaceae bacterium]|nr:hypothetical protein [Gemmatimonadaceae bacterium]
MRFKLFALLSRSVFALCLSVAAAHDVSAQASLGPRTVEGRVRRPMGERGDSTGMGPATGVWVTLHRVGKDSAGPMDSIRTDAAGVYRLRYTPWGASDAVYFASTTYGGIAYFSEPLRAVRVAGDAAEITVFDTTSRTFPLAIKGRHLIISQLDSTDMRTVIEVFEIANDSLTTLVAGSGSNPPPTWMVTVPSTAREVRANENEFSPETFVATEGKVSVFAPIAPGIKQIAFSYKLPSSSFPLAMRATHGAVVFEVLLEEPQGNVKGKGFTTVGPVSIEGRNFWRFLAQDVVPDADLIIDLPSGAAPGRNLYIAGLLVAVGFLMMLALTRSMQRARAKREGNAQPARMAVADGVSSERLAQEIAALDAMYAKQESPTDAVRHAYETRRAELKAALSEALAEESSRR